MGFVLLEEFVVCFPEKGINIIKYIYIYLFISFKKKKKIS